MIVAGNYGYFRDELYYIDAGRHFQTGYVDFPPFIAWLAGILRIFGDNLVVLHFFSALANAALIVVTGLMARELGGGRRRADSCCAGLGGGGGFHRDRLALHDGRLRRAVVGAGGVRLHPPRAPRGAATLARLRPDRGHRPLYEALDALFRFRAGGGDTIDAATRDVPHALAMAGRGHRLRVSASLHRLADSEWLADAGVLA